MMIESLTEEQKDKFSVYVDKWVEIGLSTESIDLVSVAPIISDVYKESGLTVPEKIVVCGSPFAAIEYMKKNHDIDVSVYDFTYGSHEASWLSFYDYLYRVVGIEDCSSLLSTMKFAGASGWALFYDELVVLTERPSSLKFDDQNRTHCEDDFAIKYPDGTGVAVWHGQQIPEEWIFDKSTITSDVAMRWGNIEQRRCACEILGWANVLEMLKSRLLDEDIDPTIGKLLEVELPDVGKEKFLLALDPNTGTPVGLPVPQKMKTALEANSWTYGIDKVEFVPDFRV